MICTGVLETAHMSMSILYPTKEIISWPYHANFFMNIRPESLKIVKIRLESCKNHENRQSSIGIVKNRQNRQNPSGFVKIRPDSSAMFFYENYVFFAKIFFER